MINYIIATLISIIATTSVYKLIYPVFTYSNITDFYVGTTIYNNHNKYLDLYSLFIYILFFFTIFFICKKIIPSIKNFKTINLIPLNIPFQNQFLKYQALYLLGFVYLHPFNGHIYKPIIILILLLITIGIFDIKNRKSKTYSPFALAGIIFILFHLQNPYLFPLEIIDDHHLGESIATYYQYKNFNLSFYKDIMLVHGFTDIIPSFLGDFFFNDAGIIGSKLGEILYKNLIFIFSIILGLYLFAPNYIFIVPIITRIPHLSILYFISYLLLMTKNINKRPLICLIIYTIITFYFAMTWTTIGTFCLIATMPFAIYMLSKLIKESKNKKIFNILVLISTILILFLINKELINNYIMQATYYVKGNLLAFGNDFGEYNFTLEKTIHFFKNLFIYIIIPYLIMELYIEIKKENKNYIRINILLFFIIFPLVSTNYTLGRIDGISFSRICNISTTYLCLVLPFYLYTKYREKDIEKFKSLMQIILGIYILFVALKIYNNNSFLTKEYKLLKQDTTRIENIQNFVSKNTNKDEIFLDLSNRGMNYFYLEKQSPLPYTSYYNSISTIQSKNSLEKIKNNPPKVIFIGFYNANNDFSSPIFDKVYPSLRIYPIFKWLLLEGNYKLVKEKGNVYFIKSNEKITYTKKEKEVLDNILSTNNLEYLPQVWGNSMNTLKIEKQNIEFLTTKSKNKLTIKFKENVAGKTLNLLHLHTKQNINSYKIKINGEDNNLNLKIKGSNSLLISIDSIPSWLLKNDINEIIIEEEIPSNEEYEIAFYKRR